jgi:hypothetical protein
MLNASIPLSAEGQQRFGDGFGAGEIADEEPVRRPVGDHGHLDEWMGYPCAERLEAGL